MRRQPLVIILIAAGLAAGVAFSQQAKKFRTSTVTARSMELDWESNVIEFAGNCKLTVGGQYNATMTAPSMTVTVAGKPAAVKSLVAKGPVNFTVITRPDSKGVKRQITASAKEQATYSEDTQTVRLVGEAQADMAPLDGAESVEAVHFTGQTITANLKTSRMTVDDANLTVKTEME